MNLGRFFKKRGDKMGNEIKYVTKMTSRIINPLGDYIIIDYDRPLLVLVPREAGPYEIVTWGRIKEGMFVQIMDKCLSKSGKSYICRVNMVRDDIFFVGNLGMGIVRGHGGRIMEKNQSGKTCPDCGSPLPDNGDPCGVLALAKDVTLRDKEMRVARPEDFKVIREANCKTLGEKIGTEVLFKNRLPIYKAEPVTGTEECFRRFDGIPHIKSWLVRYHNEFRVPLRHIAESDEKKYKMLLYFLFEYFPEVIGTGLMAKLGTKANFPLKENDIADVPVDVPIPDPCDYTNRQIATGMQGHRSPF
jgi:hypothetical protein